MIHRRYHIRAGAKTTAGGTVSASSMWYTVNGIPLALEGDPVDCPACGTQGFIQCVAPRLTDRFQGKEYALSDDLCICKCVPPPKLIADQNVKCQVLLLASEESAEETAARKAKERAASVVYDERPKLVAPPVEGVPYFVETKDGRTFSGRTGTDGLLPRIDTHGEDNYTVYWGDEALTKMEGVEA